MSEQTTTPDPAPGQQGWHDAGLAAWWTWDRYRNAVSPLDAANHLVELNNAMADLVTWLPGYDVDTGTPREADDDE
jgi:hypothetical protein